MPDKKITIKRGERANVEIPIARDAPASPEKARRDPLRPSDVDDDDLYTFQKGITFYDLGTRKTEDGNYAHVAFESFTASDPYPQLITNYHAALLAGDFTKGSTCLKLPQASEYLWADAVFVRQEGENAGEQKKELIGNEDKRFYVNSIPTIFPPVPVPDNVMETHWRSARLQFKEKGQWAFMVQSVWFYNSFRTDTNQFKVTETADPAEVGEAEAVPFTYKGGELMKVFLTPRCRWNAQFGSDPDTYHVSRLLPVLPAFEPEQANPFTHVDADIFESRADAYATSDFWGDIDAYYAGIYPEWNENPVPFIGDDGSAQNLSGDGPILVAVIVKGGKRLYIWQTGTTPSTSWQESRVYNPGF